MSHGFLTVRMQARPRIIIIIVALTPWAIKLTLLRLESSLIMKKRKSLQEGKDVKVRILRLTLSPLNYQRPMLKKARLAAPTKNSLNKRKPKHWRITCRYSFTRGEHVWLGPWADVNLKVGRKFKNIAFQCGVCVSETTMTKQTAGSKSVNRLSEAKTIAAVKRYSSSSLSAGYQTNLLRIEGKLESACLWMSWSRQRELCQLTKMASATRCLQSDSWSYKTEPGKWSTNNILH